MIKIYQKMYLKKKNRYKAVLEGFTLIELLVVILIIGILASVALPQYQKAVEKSRIMALMPNLRILKESLERYYIANGVYPADSLEDVDLTISGCRIITGGVLQCGDYCFNYNGGISSFPNPYIAAGIHTTGCNQSLGTTTLKWYLSHSALHADEKYCESTVTGVCESLSGFLSP